ncbi:ABC transporter permease [Candidatus Nitrotoga sp. M5]|uniref:ABC transporter permease n=1 Tax=Candidatus Nitrotoga sp. M5 TaxID=2890409 RepID=UPI001EF55322|nr:ABC transporter permease [Candidatus Nitrotoga sp. M5]CAH1387124.1 ABC exporter membrane subunit YbhR [Candidatus Nitrotoga sp. M5]
MRLFSPRLMAQIVKELLSVLRDPKSRFVLIVPPLVQLFVFSFAATLDVRNVDIAIYDRDAGKWSHELVERIGAAQFVHRLLPAQSPAEFKKMVEQREVIAVINIPEYFSRNIDAGRIGKVQVILDGRRANTGQVVLGYLNNIAGGLNAELTTESRLTNESAVVNHWFNPNLIYRWFIVPSIGGILVTFITLLVTALSIARERELGTFDQLLVSPCTPIEIIVSKMAPALLINTVLGLFMVAAGIFLFGIPFTGNFLLLLISMVLFILSLVGIGLMISAVCSTQQQAILGTFAIGVPAVLMSGFATPVENMPTFLQWLAQAIPLKHYLIILQGSFLKALPPSEVFANAWPMAVIAMVTLTAATLFVRGKLQ